jgi:hypothetical protein
MPKRVVDLRTERPLLDIASLGRRGPDARLTPSEVASIARTARRVPEVMIKVSKRKLFDDVSPAFEQGLRWWRVPAHRRA